MGPVKCVIRVVYRWSLVTDVDEGTDDGVYAIMTFKIDPAVIIDIKRGRGLVNHTVIQLTLRHFRMDCL